MDKPRLCDILGVDVNERFGIEGRRSLDYVDENGTLQTIDDEGVSWEEVNIVICDIIEHPEHILHIHQWTEKDKADAKAVKQLWPKACRIKRSVDNKVSFSQYVDTAYQNVCWTELGQSAFPSLRCEEDAIINDILGGDNDGCFFH